MQLGVTTVNICLVDLSDAVAEAARRLSGGGGRILGDGKVCTRRTDHDLHHLDYLL